MPSAIYYFSRAFVRQSFNNFVKFRENTSETKDEVCVKVILFQKSDFYPLVLKERHQRVDKDLLLCNNNTIKISYGL
jgi:hypothetical protein